MRNTQVVAEGLVEMLAMGLEDILAGEHTLEDGEPSVSDIDGDEHQIAKRLGATGRGLHESAEKEEDDAPHEDGSDVAGETTRPPTEVEDGENGDGEDEEPYQVGLDKGPHEDVDIPQRTEDDEGIARQHAVDAIHKVVYIDDGEGDKEEQQEFPDVERESVKLEEDEEDGDELGAETQPSGELPDVVDIADDGDEEATDKQPRVTAGMGGAEIEERQQEDDAATEERDLGMGAALVGTVDDIKLLSHCKI